MVELEDTLHLGCNALGVRVRISPSVPNARLAQMEEQLTCNQKAVGSSPSTSILLLPTQQDKNKGCVQYET